MGTSKRVIFFSTMGNESWGGSEELWGRTAIELASQGLSVSAGVLQHTPPHPRIIDLQMRGVTLRTRHHRYSLGRQPWRWYAARRDGPAAYDLARLVAARAPGLIVLSDGGPFPPIELIEFCVARALPFVTVGQANTESIWYDDDIAERYRAALPRALACFFVSSANLRLAEKQLGGAILNAEVVWNPVNVSRDANPGWPDLDEKSEIHFAAVGRLHPPSKGQDILLEALAAPQWRNRPWRLYFYGDGRMKRGLEWLTTRLGLADRVVFAGFAAVEDIWASNHVLVMPSRYEGLPLTMVEAMLCGRPVIATNVAGHAEIIEHGVTGFLADAATPHAMAAALEQFWNHRLNSKEIGKAGAFKIRQLMPSDPVQVFAERLKNLGGLI